MAVTVAISFLLIIPIEPIVWLLALPSGMLIGYYANQRSDRRAGPWRILVNGLFAALLTGLTMAVLLVGVKALFFFADNGYRDEGLGRGIDPALAPRSCVYQRYLDLGRGTDFESAGVVDVGTFTRSTGGSRHAAARSAASRRSAAWLARGCTACSRPSRVGAEARLDVARLPSC